MHQYHEHGNILALSKHVCFHFNICPQQISDFIFSFLGFVDHANARAEVKHTLVFN